ncbi:MAG: 50S ribosomal protein L4 [Nitrosomonas sp.]|nr:50S ribosomal protein L4 [Nitrosomonas sp.]MBX3641130.1 50S ribosomal protein L4 [Nitrosomonas sp.]MCW5606887.1 50S ribosomal protein L4 [Nitrosomonas sp.]
MELKLINEQKQDIGSISVSDSLFNREYNEAIVHQIVTSYLSNSRSATRAQKDRSSVAKSNRKPWRQKGTGRARVGRASSPIWRGGGKVFPNNPQENYKKKINKKMYRVGMSTILSKLVRDDRLTIIDTFTMETHKTKEFKEKLKILGFENLLLITDELKDTLYLSSRNMPDILVIEADSIDPVNLLKFDKTLVTTNSIRKFEELFL